MLQYPTVPLLQGRAEDGKTDKYGTGRGSNLVVSSGSPPSLASSGKTLKAAMMSIHLRVVQCRQMVKKEPKLLLTMSHTTNPIYRDAGLLSENRFRARRGARTWVASLLCSTSSPTGDVGTTPSKPRVRLGGLGVYTLAFAYTLVLTDTLALVNDSTSPADTMSDPTNGTAWWTAFTGHDCLLTLLALAG